MYKLIHQNRDIFDSQFGGATQEKCLISEQSEYSDTMPVDFKNTFVIENTNPPEGEVIAIEEQTILPYSPPSTVSTITIPSGTILYHGSKTVDTFDPSNIQLEEKTLVSFFSTDKNLAADAFGRCSNFSKNGFLHKFIVKKPIEKVLVKSIYTIKDSWNLKYIEEEFCSRKKTDHGVVFNGVAFFIPRPREEGEPIDTTISPDILMEAHIALCDPNEYLFYASTQRCIALNKLGDETWFNA